MFAELLELPPARKACTRIEIPPTAEAVSEMESREEHNRTRSGATARERAIRRF